MGTGGPQLVNLKLLQISLIQQLIGSKIVLARVIPYHIEDLEMCCNFSRAANHLGIVLSLIQQEPKVNYSLINSKLNIKN